MTPVQSAVVERIKLNGNLATLYESALRFISRYCDLWDSRPRGSRPAEDVESPVPARANYHRGALREAVANMLVHRDLALRDQPTRLNIFDRTIEFINPRRTQGFSPVAQKAIRYGLPERLNPQISAIFLAQRMRWIYRLVDCQCSCANLACSPKAHGDVRV